MSFPHQGIQATGKRDFLGERHQDLRPEPKNLCVCAREVSRWPWGWHHQDRQHPICGKTWCLCVIKCVLLWPAAATLGSHLIGMCVVFHQAIVLLVLLWHFYILNIQSLVTWGQDKQAVMHCKRKLNCVPLHCLFFLLDLHCLSSPGGDERAELLLLFPANCSFHVHEQPGHRGVHDPNSPRGSVGLQRPSSHEDPLHEARGGRTFWADVEGKRGCVHDDSSSMTL